MVQNVLSQSCVLLQESAALPDANSSGFYAASDHYKQQYTLACAVQMQVSNTTHKRQSK